MPSRISLEEVRRQEPTGSLRQTTDGVLIELLGHAEFRKARSRVGRGRESPDSVDVGAGRPAVVGKKRMSVELGALGGVLPVEEPARQKVVPVFARGIEKIEPDVAPRGRVGLDDRQPSRKRRPRQDGRLASSRQRSRCHAKSGWRSSTFCSVVRASVSLSISGCMPSQSRTQSRR